MAKVVTANMLRSGEVVYLASGSRWVRSLADAVVARDSQELARLETEAAQSAGRQEVTAVYTMDVKVEGQGAAPASMRERIRAALGPTV